MVTTGSRTQNCSVDRPLPSLPFHRRPTLLPLTISKELNFVNSHHHHEDRRRSRYSFGFRLCFRTRKAIRQDHLVSAATAMVVVPVLVVVAVVVVVPTNRVCRLMSTTGHVDRSAIVGWVISKHDTVKTSLVHTQNR